MKRFLTWLDQRTRTTGFKRGFLVCVMIIAAALFALLFWQVHENSSKAAENAAVARARGQALGTANAKLTQNGIPEVKPTSADATPGNTEVGPTTPSSTPKVGPKVGPQGERGAQGDNGVGVTHVDVNKTGDLIVDLTDGTTLNAGHVVGATGATGKSGSPGTDGADGDDGRGITSTSIVDGALVLTYTGGDSRVIGQVVGPQGTDGKNGSDGADGKNGRDGRSVTGVTVSGDFHLIVTYSDGTTSDAGRLPAGPAGPAGKDGADGKDGRGIKNAKCVDGEWAITYTDGTTSDGGSCVATTTVTAPPPSSSSSAPSSTSTP